MTPMVVQCSSCLTEFELDPNKVPAAGVRARCSVCSAVITVPAPIPTASQRTAQEHPAEATTASEATAFASHSTPVAVEVPPAPLAAPMPPAPVAPPPPTTPPAFEPAPAPESWRQVEPAPVAAVAATHDVAPEPPEAKPVAAAAESPWALPKPSIAPAISPVEADAGQRRPINPFLTRDPALRAKRLARALVSDIVAYHPARHAEGLRDGTLKTLFRDEIKKSYEEYVDQVGRDFAGSTTHFQDALNDVLASGKKLF